jgi:hypothetical protein
MMYTLGRRTIVAALAAFALLITLATPASASVNFNINCKYTRTLSDDPIVFPGQPGASHSHDFFGNKTTDAFSTYQTLAGQATSCGDAGDTAAYWAPTLYNNGVVVRGSLKAYYYNKYTNLGHVAPFPPGLQMVAGDSHAMGPQSTNFVYFGCGDGTGISKVTYLPDCTPVGGKLQIHVIFPDCWSQVGLTRENMTYAVKGVCPTGYVRTVQLIERFTFATIIDARGVTLASGPFYTFHADFFNSWNQAALVAKVATL